MFSGADFHPQDCGERISCRHCNKAFKTQRKLMDHEELCRARTILGTEGEDSDATGRELLAMLRLQRKEIELLKKELAFAKKGEIKQKKVDILSWLDENLKPDITYLELLERMQSSVDNMHTVFDHGYLHATSMLFSEFYESYGKGSMPLYAFTQKEGQLFCYTGERWRILSPGMWDQACIVMKKIQMEGFESWKEEEITDIYETKQQNLWLDRMQRLQCIPPYGCSNLNNKLKKKIFQHIKISFKGLSDHLPE